MGQAIAEQEGQQGRGGGAHPTDLELALFDEVISEETINDRIAYLMTATPEAPYLAASYSEILDMDLGRFMFLLERKDELISSYQQQRKGQR